MQPRGDSISHRWNGLYQKERIKGAGEEDAEEREGPHCPVECQRVEPCGKLNETSSKWHFSLNPAILLWLFYPKELKSICQRDVRTLTFTEAQYPNDENNPRALKQKGHKANVA